MASRCTYFGLPCENYQTTTARYHRFIPSFQQEFNVHVKPQIQPNLLVKDVAVNDETFKTETRTKYCLKLKHFDRYGRASQASQVNYIRPVQEHFLKLKIPAPKLKISETKASFGINKYECIPINFQLSTGMPSNPINKSTTGAEFSIPAEEKGYWKHVDPYLTNNRYDYKFTNDSDMLKDKIITFYNSKECVPHLSGNQLALRNRTFSRAPKYLRLLSETKDKYKPILPYPIDFCIKMDKCATSIC